MDVHLFRVGVDGWISTRPGLIDIITSFPVLIIMIVMKKTDHVAAWIVKLPAFRIYILRSRFVPPSLHFASSVFSACSSVVT